MKTGKVCFKDTEICSAGIADSYFLRLRGLVGRNVNELGSLWIKPCNQIHCCFMSYPIDVVYLDKELRIVKIDYAVAPWKFRPPVKNARSVLELPAGKSAEFGLKTGEKIEISV